MRTVAKLLVVVLLIARSIVVCADEERGVRSPDGAILAVAEEDCTVTLRDFVIDSKIAVLYKPKNPPVVPTPSANAPAQLQLHCSPLISFSPDGKLLATNRPDEETILWSAKDGRELAKLNKPTLPKGFLPVAVDLHFSADSGLILELSRVQVGKMSDVNKITVWDFSTRKMLFHAREDENTSINRASFPPDGKTVMALVGSRSRNRETSAPWPTDTIKLWDIGSGKKLVSLRGQSAEFSPDSKVLYVTDSGRRTALHISKMRPLEQSVSAPSTAGISADNVAESVGNNRWNWTVFIKGGRDDMEHIKCVEYTLHPSFPNPVRRVCAPGDPQRPFGLSAKGWGTFSIGIRVFMKDGSHEDFKHQLKF
jgi:hypothetical protein